MVADIVTVAAEGRRWPPELSSLSFCRGYVRTHACVQSLIAASGRRSPASNRRV
jgi:hypothetical protein